MGWDAFAMTAGGRYVLKSGPGGWAHAPAYAAAADRVRETEGSVDFLLKHGGLDVSDCGEALRLATGLDVRCDDWTPETVQMAHRTAQWEKAAAVPSWAVASARAFLATAAAEGHGVRFTW